MLSDLIIKNFAIVEHLHVSFQDGFNVLTGETGAGKSIIIDAVNLLLGGRARGDVIRTGTEEATVEAIFEVGSTPLLNQKLVDMGLENGDELLVRRIVTRSGKNRIYVNGSPVPLAQLRELTPLLVNIYGQHEHQGLQRVETHLPLLDIYAGCQSEAEAYKEAFVRMNEIAGQLQRLELAERERQQRLDMLSFQRQEIAAADLQPGEDLILEQERRLLQHAGRLSEASHGGYRTLYAGNGAVCEQLTAVAESLAGLQQIDPLLGELSESLKSALYTVEDVATQLRDYAQKLSFEPQRQQQVEDRLAQLKTLKRKYAPTVEELLAFLQKLDAELDDLQDIDGRRRELQQQLVQAEADLREKGGCLSAKRLAAAGLLSQLVERELSDLAMTNARFEVRLLPQVKPGVDGLESGEFYLAANAGENAQPLARVASGGELSRIMLALRRSIPDGDTVRTLIFDEVDAGIGGEAASAVGEKICRLGEGMQVLCVTHLPQVAAFGHHHYRVAKQQVDGRTRTSLTLLQGEPRVQEMARMLGGAQVTERTLDHARELLDRSHTLA
ncbi:DNA repair protein RecN [Geopsychrobacter electrodiphilus]|uniref:DNA repair protein RecN n=1 Tax=Geopsychrobacter electrodiphilus TaxID=225196 RepID=UPI00037CCEA7|nr:DNA repair protein RecN [Geopsychrobacter electrodiphilus]